MTKENKGIILVADDDPSLIKTTEMLIDMGFPGFKIEPFEDGTSLEERLNQDVSDVRLVITDNTMPGPNGSE
ncbi:MAG TPA: response regulator, partial [Candidatus Pacearchaeota archaeon]|nr:response regulator [Candidatus Pacearchaeota archaeon]